jgi:hypothetical protein
VILGNVPPAAKNLFGKKVLGAPKTFLTLFYRLLIVDAKKKTVASAW